MKLAIELAERGLIPDRLIGAGKRDFPPSFRGAMEKRRPAVVSPTAHLFHGLRRALGIQEGNAVDGLSLPNGQAVRVCERFVRAV
jgi:hypothetical protein